MKPDRRDRRFDDDLAEIADEQIDRIDQEDILDLRTVAVNRIEDSGSIHQQHREYGPQILDIPEEHKKRRKDQAYAQIEQHQHADGVQQHDKLPGKCDMVKEAEDEQDDQGKAEIDQGLHIFGQQKQVLRNVDLGKDRRIAHQRSHPLRSRLVKIGEDHVAAEDINGIMRCISPKKLREHQAHDEQRQQGRDHAPGHAQNGPLIFLFEISLDQFLQKKLVLF